MKAIEKPQVTAKVRGTAEREFSLANTGNAAKKLFENVLENEKKRWTAQDGLQRKTYNSYEEYVKHQKSKLDGGIKFDLSKYDAEYGKELKERLEKIGLEGNNRLCRLSNSSRALNVLCLGARQGTEVKAFLDIGCFAVGIDLNPGKDNKYVVTGDFHNLTYGDNSVDIVFTNSLDHVYRPRKFLSEITRVLRQNGTFLIELEGPKDKDADKWASLHWDRFEDLCKLFAEFGLKLIKEADIESIWFRKQAEFRLNGGE